ncbi:MAG: hypothetical protein KDC95_14395 [Planctomycetes bacterium]|nr:hypothetical protein [Planctomycetota bacterium]
MTILILGGLAVIAAIWTPSVPVKVIATVVAAGLTCYSAWMFYCASVIVRSVGIRRGEQAIARVLYWRRSR